MINVSIADMSNIERMLAGCSEESVKRAIRAAITRTLKGARRKAASKAAERYTAKVGDIAKTLKKKVTGTTGELVSKSSRLSLTKFNHSPKKRPKRARKGNPYLYSEVLRGKKVLMEHFFLAKKDIFERAGQPRFPIEKKFGPSAAEMLGKPPVSTYIAARMEERIKIDVMHEVGALLGGFRS